MPRWRWWAHCNPPDSYTDHARDIRDRFGLGEDSDRIVVLYALGPAIEITITGGHDELSRFSRVAEELVLEGGLHIQGSSPSEVWFTPDEKQALSRPQTQS